MPTKRKPDLSDWVTPETLAQEFPDVPVATIRYLMRRSVRLTNGFDVCVRFLTPRKVLISRTRFAAWLDKQVSGGKVA